MRSTFSRYRDIVENGEHTAEVTIQDGIILEGDLPPKALSMVREWISINSANLMTIWDSQEFCKIAPLE
ncbi:DUF4160 domain-containing protein [Eubacterium sp. AB3007]|uniref:DUF4160 domain-containing protein n=1 Tax=Eubacterium sp. AB3007 TaxID=1392487 RepID=UPI0009E00A24